MLGPQESVKTGLQNLEDLTPCGFVIDHCKGGTLQETVFSPFLFVPHPWVSFPLVRFGGFQGLDCFGNQQCFNTNQQFNL